MPRGYYFIWSKARIFYFLCNFNAIVWTQMDSKIILNDNKRESEAQVL